MLNPIARAAVWVLYLSLVNVLAFILHVFEYTYLAGVVGFGGTALGLLAALAVIVNRSRRQRRRGP